MYDVFISNSSISVQQGVLLRKTQELGCFYYYKYVIQWKLKKKKHFWLGSSYVGFSQPWL